MLNESDLVTVVCPHCGSESQKPISWLKDVASAKCGCGDTVYTDINEVSEFQRKEPSNTLAKLRLRPVPV